ncbi:hypothetical protein TrVE_jg5497 [Triparma verrucosa]|uniref:Uncharacterized protein n=1 Tax=Triparma verrucosa TaxID=1606542 RepID=A0A9W7FL63_9STRA|nr:hypothetical protein TrVE_jg5497 [Triparma verrucosa]
MNKSLRQSCLIVLLFLLLLFVRIDAVKQPNAEEIESFITTLKASKGQTFAGFATGLFFGKKLEAMFSSIIRLALIFPLVTSWDTVQNLIRKHRKGLGPVKKQLEKGLDDFCSSSGNSACDSRKIRRMLKAMNIKITKVWQQHAKPFIKYNNTMVSGFLLGLGLRMLSYAIIT